uniref:CCHC-type domain-containing protein n=1 Tax=Romanomermis culicivorax TaxID=13658 RepID=A0A915IFE4_ROMCU
MDNELRSLTAMIRSLVEQTANKWQHTPLRMPPRQTEYCYICRDLGHLAHKCPQQCYKCGLTGHKPVRCTTTTTMANHTRKGMEIANKAFSSLQLQPSCICFACLEYGKQGHLTTGQAGVAGTSKKPKIKMITIATQTENEDSARKTKEKENEYYK